jgi:hypothetical protein
MFLWNFGPSPYYTEFSPNSVICGREPMRFVIPETVCGSRCMGRGTPSHPNLRFITASSAGTLVGDTPRPPIPIQTEGDSANSENLWPMQTEPRSKTNPVFSSLVSISLYSLSLSTHYLLFYVRRSSERWDETQTNRQCLFRGQLYEVLWSYPADSSCH